MKIPNTKGTASIVQTNGINGEIDNYLVSIKNSNLLTDGDYILVNAPSEITFTNKTLCAARTNVKGF